jgi:hypothetical protein
VELRRRSGVGDEGKDKNRGKVGRREEAREGREVRDATFEWDGARRRGRGGVKVSVGSTAALEGGAMSEETGEGGRFSLGRRDRSAVERAKSSTLRALESLGETGGDRGGVGVNIL